MSGTAPRSVTEIVLRILQHSTPDRLNFTFDTESSRSDLRIREKPGEAMRWNSDEQKWSVARPKPYPDFIKMVMGYALTCNMQLPAVSDMITEARYQARKNGCSAIAQQAFAAHFSIIRFRPIKRWNRHSSRR